MPLRIAFRTDASVEIGAGHVMRCLALADELRLRGAECHFICRTLGGHMGQKISDRGYRTHLLPPLNNRTNDSDHAGYASWLGVSWENDALQTIELLDGLAWDWLVVDHYALDSHWEAAMHGRARRLMAIDDLANRRHEVDLLLDQNLGRDTSHYSGLVPEAAIRLVGPGFALLRPEFAALRTYSLQRRQRAEPQRLLVSLGGTDPRNVTSRVLTALADVELPSGVSVFVVLGAGSPWQEVVAELASRVAFPCKLLIEIDDMARRMADSDLAIGAAGGSSWERCVLGLPSVMITLAENQREIARALHAAGAAVSVPDGGSEALGETVLALLHDRNAMNRMSVAAARQCDGLGTGRVATAILAGFSE